MATGIDELAKKVRQTAQRNSNAFLRIESWDNTNSEIDFEFVNLGRIVDASVDSDPVATDADQDGRESASWMDLTVQLSMMQGSNVELSTIPDLAMPEDPNDNGLYMNGHTIYFSGSNTITTTEVNNALGTDDDTAGVSANEGRIQFASDGGSLDDRDGIVFENVIMKPSPSIPFGGEASLIQLEMNGRVHRTEFASVDTDHIITFSPKTR